jgi:hypothetical protein
MKDIWDMQDMMSFPEPFVCEPTISLGMNNITSSSPTLSGFSSVGETERIAFVHFLLRATQVEERTLTGTLELHFQQW